MNLPRIAILTALCLSAVGCGPSAPSLPQSPVVPPELGRDFDPATTGALRGTVTWNGQLPDVPPLIVNLPFLPGKSEPNPNRPRIDKETKAIRGAVVYLHNIDLARSRPWDHRPVQVAVEKQQINVYQGDTIADVGLVRQGESVQWSNRDADFFSLRARGAAFFSLPFVKPTPSHRPLPSPGYVEVSSGSKQYWLRGHLFVSPHPYVCVTDEHGAFQMPRVPAGEYEIRCWLPNWEIKERQTDPEWRTLVRLVFHEPLESSRRIPVSAGQETSTSLSLSPKTP